MNTTITKQIICYGQINNGSTCQEHYESGSRDASRRATQLRRLGYDVIVSSLGLQVTSVGKVKLTMVHIMPGEHIDTYNLPEVQIERI